MSQLIELRDLWIATHQRDLVKGVDVDIFPEQVTALCGPSGSGKSLTARAMMSVLDVSPGLKGGHLRYPTINANRDWFADVVGKGMSAQQRLLKQTQHLRGHFVTYSPQSARLSIRGVRSVGRWKWLLHAAILRQHHSQMKCCVFSVKLGWIERQ